MTRLAIWLALVLAVCMAQQAAALDPPRSKVSATSAGKNSTRLDPVSKIDQQLLSAMRRIPGAERLNSKQAKTLLAARDSQELNVQFSTTDLLSRSGFKYELHNSTSVDGYITQLVRIINPKAVRSAMKVPPVVLYAGQGASPAVFLMTSSGRGQPLLWPRDEDWPAAGLDGNRSLALTLANNGYDVWLVPARGVDGANRERIVPVEPEKPKVVVGKKSLASLTPRDLKEGLKLIVKVRDPKQYWSFSDDEIIKYELNLQLSLVLKVTKFEKLSLINYSNGGFITFGFMAHNPDFARRYLDTIISIAPAVFVDKFNLVLGASGLLSKLASLASPYPEDRIDVMARRGFSHLCKPKSLRYSVCKLVLDQLYGHSDMFNTRLELSILDYIGRPLSARGLRQTLQVAYSGHFRQYDFGPLANLVEYNKPVAPAYDLGAIKHKRLFIISGGKDSIVSDRSINRLIGQLRTKPEKLINVPGYNHLDLLAGFDNTERVNMPILHILDDRDLEANYYPEDPFGSKLSEQQADEDSDDEPAGLHYFVARSNSRVPLGVTSKLDVRGNRTLASRARALMLRRNHGRDKLTANQAIVSV